MFTAHHAKPTRRSRSGLNLRQLSSWKDWPAFRRGWAVILDQSEFSDYRLLKLRPLPAADDNLDPADFRSVKVYAIGHRLPESKIVRVRARVLVESKTKDIVLLATETLPLEDEISSFKLTPEDKANFAKYYTPSLFEDVDRFFIPRMVGQTLRKQLIQLVLHSPVWIRLPDKTRIRGLLRLLLVGDTKTYKSKGLVWITERLHLGEIIFGETSSRTGLLYTIDSENRMLIWGAIPRNDLGTALIAGLHGVSADELSQFREVLEFLRVKVSRMVDGEAHCRCRIIADSNPRRDSMKEYLLPCEAIKDLPFFRSTPDVTRWDFYFISRREDVDQAEIDNAVESDPTIPFQVQRRHILWAQSRKMENIVFEQGVLEAVNRLNADLVKTYGSESLPIVHSGFRESVIRSAVSMAATLHSVDDSGENIVVKLKHVEKVQTVLTWLFDNNLELDRYVNAERERTVLTDQDLETLIREAGDAIDLLTTLRSGALQSSVLAEKLNMPASTVRDHGARLKAMDLIRSSRGRAGGYELTSKGVSVLRWMMPRDQSKMTEKSAFDIKKGDPPKTDTALSGQGGTRFNWQLTENPTFRRKSSLIDERFESVELLHPNVKRGLQTPIEPEPDDDPLPASESRQATRFVCADENGQCDYSTTVMTEAALHEHGTVLVNLSLNRGTTSEASNLEHADPAEPEEWEEEGQNGRSEQGHQPAIVKRGAQRIDLALVEDFLTHTALPQQEARVGYGTEPTLSYAVRSRFSDGAAQLVRGLLLDMKRRGIVSDDNGRLRLTKK